MGHHEPQSPISGDGEQEKPNENKRETQSQQMEVMEHEDLSQSEKASLPPPKITCGAPRWFVIVIYSLYGFLTGAAYFNWTPMADMLYKDGAFEWQCTTEKIREFVTLGQAETKPRCVEQELSIGRLFSVLSASEFGFAAFAGFLLDTMGPKLTAVVGTLMCLSGWVLLSLGSEGLNTFIVASMLLGGSSEMCFYPLLPAADLYPGRESTIMAIFGTFRSISLLIPLVMRAINVEAGISTFREIVLGFACICIAGCFLLALLFMPRKAWPRQKDQLQAMKLEDETESKQSTRGATQKEKHTKGDKGFTAWRRAQWEKGSYLRELCSWAFGLMALAYICVIIDVMFFIPSTLHLLPNAYSANQIIQIFSFLPCPVLGYAADRIGILWVMQFVNLCGFLTYFFVVVPKIPTYPVMQFIAAVFCSMQVSFMSSQLYCYGNHYLSQRNLGKLIGTAFCLAGFISLSTNPMRRFALEHGFTTMCGVAMALSALAAVLLAVLQYMDKKNMLIPASQEGGEAEDLGIQEESTSVQRQSDVEMC